MIKIDGSFGEGGGQILRTSLGLAALLQKPLHIFNIRAKRTKPGLRPQHLACVKAIQSITKAEIKGAEIGSKELVFVPEGIYPGEYVFDIGTAGSTSLVLQSMLLPLTVAQDCSFIRIKGGTHVPWSPPFHYLRYVFAPTLADLGVKIELNINKWGFYPEGGGEIEGKIYSFQTLKAKNWLKPPVFSQLKAISICLNLPEHIRKRQANTLINQLEKIGLKAELREEEAKGRGKGSFLFLWIDEQIKAGFSALGARGKAAEKVAEEVFNAFFLYYKSKVAMDPHLSDQIVPYLCLAPGKSEFTTIVSSHLLTNIWVINQFLKRKITCSGKIGQVGKVEII
ncbi:MAG: RNA 3'-phosphate cyclase [Candidatus Desulfofervidus sp.]|nr:RNA 3'-phosphate cyclase [Candidatus Desulfofervidus sp.]